MNVTSPVSEDRVARCYENCVRSGVFYFQSGRIGRSGDWKRTQHNCEETEDRVTASVNVVDKLKVLTTAYSTSNVSKQFMMINLEGVQELAPKRRPIRGNGVKVADIFLQAVCKVSKPAGTIASYKRGDITYQQNGHNLYLSNKTFNKRNINMPRGIHEYVVLNRVLCTHTICTNPYSRMTFVFDMNKGNNNSLTTDSLINSVSKGLSFKLSVCGNKEGFVLATMASFGTHKTVAVYNNRMRFDGFMAPISYRDKTPTMEIPVSEEEEGHSDDREITKEEALGPTRGNEIQVHEHCYNCSAVTGTEIMPIMCEKGAQLLEDKSISVSLAVNNFKAGFERASRSLMWESINSFVDLFCWQHNTRYMTKEQEMSFYIKRCVPLLKMLRVSRDNYAQAGSFCQQSQRTCPFFTTHEMKLVSHKFKNPRTKEYFSRVNIRFPGLIKSREKTTTVRGRYRDAVLRPQCARNEGVVRRYEQSTQVFRDRFDLIKPLETDL
jgi:hypothetical protein